MRSISLRHGTCTLYAATAIILIVAVTVCQFMFTVRSRAMDLFLNEIMASNATTILDDDGDPADWVEIFNAGSEPINLNGYGLSDDYNRPFRWIFPEIVIQPGAFLLVWASGKDRTDPSSSLHTNFSIAATGEEIILTAPDGTRVDELPPTELQTGISIGRKPDGFGEWFFFDKPTPGSSNTSTGYQEVLAPVIFYPIGGFYSDAHLYVELYHPDPDVTIIYSLDGTEPHPHNVQDQTYEYKHRYRRNFSDQDGTIIGLPFRAYIYSAPIKVTDRSTDENRLSTKMSTFDNNPTPYYYPSEPIFKGTVIRARAVKEGALPTPIITHSYFISPDSRDRFSLPVISLVTQEDYLFDYEHGIYVPGKVYDEWRSSQPWGSPDGGTPANYHQRGIEWERMASFELFEPGSGSAAIRQNIGIRIHGGWSRAEPMKSLRLYARSEYGENRFFHPIFPHLPYTQYNRFILRNSGNDWQYTLFRDAAIQEVVRHMNFDTQAYRPAIVFVNGEYWGIHNIRERFDRHFLSRTYGVDPDKVDILEGNAWIKEGSNQHYIETLQYIENNRLIEDHHYEYVSTRIDVDNFIDYQLAQIFIDNRDWPGNNIEFWRYQTNQYRPDAPYGHDGRWRWLMFDTDFGFGLYGRDPASNTLAFATEPHGPAWPNPPWATYLLRRFLENQTFKYKFINRFADQLNTAFRPERIHAVIDSLAHIIEPEMGNHIERWKRPWSMHNWQDQIQVMKNFTAVRQAHVRNHILNYFNIQRLVELTLNVSDPSAGRLYVNTIELSTVTPGIAPDPFPWTGTYFYNIPIVLRAKPWPGYRFSHWEGVPGNTDSPEITLTLTDNTTVTAVFVIDEDTELVPTPHKLGDGNYTFYEWSPAEPAASYPPNMVFVYMDELDPGLNAGIEGVTTGAYNLESRTRINGLGNSGFAFINTSNLEGNEGYPGRKLGGALLALNTQAMKDIDVTWEGMTVQPNSRIYNIRLQYRVGDAGPFYDVLDSLGNPVEYKRNHEAGHREQLGPIRLPQVVNNKAYVQLLWRYYFTGIQIDEESGQRSQLAVAGIHIEAQGSIVGLIDENTGALPEGFYLYQNYPNPFNPSTRIRFDLPQETFVELTVFDILGRRIETLVSGRLNPGSHSVNFDASHLPGGVYIYHLRADDFVNSQRMILLK